MRVAAQGVPVFLDLKLHDIPNTVAQGLTSLLSLAPAPAIVNVHARADRQCWKQRPGLLMAGRSSSP